MEELKNQPQLDQDKLNHLCQLLEQTLLALDKHKDLEANNKISQQLSEHKHSLLNHLDHLCSQVVIFLEPIKKPNLRRKNKLNRLKHHHSLETLLLLLEIIQQLLQCLAILRVLQVQIKLP